MISQTLREARQYEEAFSKLIPEEQRPAFHLSARIGWMNDPNGFSYYKGKYHLFYQYYPYDIEWGLMHWGHAVSEDLLHWEYLPAALAADEFYDRDGCFSGSAIELPDGRQLLMYTGEVKERQKNGTFSEVQTQCIAVGDGLEYEKYEKNPVLDEHNLPEGGSRIDFRDPKVWRKEDGTYCCVVGNRPADGSGQILLFTSKDGFDWKYKKVLCSNNRRFGLMWECPDFFKLDGKGVILTSPQDMMAQELEYYNGDGTLCLIGSYDEKTDSFTEEYNQSIDYGINFYAPQTLLAPDGRRIMIGWMRSNLYAADHMWHGQMSLPRELSIKNNRLYQWPIKELESMRSGKTVYENICLLGETVLDGIKGRKIDMEIEIYPDNKEEIYKEFAIHFAQNDKYYTSLSFKPYESILKFDREFSGSRKAIIHQRENLVNSENGQLKLRMILDKFSVEVFVNNGESVMSAVIYTDLSADDITFLADGKVCMNIAKYDLI